LGVIALPRCTSFAQPHDLDLRQGADLSDSRNYAHALGDPHFWRALRNTIVVVLIVVHAAWWWALPWRCSSRAVPGASLSARRGVGALCGQRGFGRGHLAFPFDGDVGLVTVALHALGLPSLDWSVVPAYGLLIVACCRPAALPFTFIILYAARLAIPTQLYEAARLDVVSGLQTFRHITLPLLMPAILVAMLFRYIFAFRLFSEVWLMTKGGPARSTEVLAVYLYLDAFRFNFRYR
jgi:multiple sugar transport system permease protein